VLAQVEPELERKAIGSPPLLPDEQSVLSDQLAVSTHAAQAQGLPSLNQ